MPYMPPEKRAAKQKAAGPPATKAVQRKAPGGGGYEQARAALSAAPRPQPLPVTDELGQLYRAFEAQTGGRTFYDGALSWLNNLVSSAEKISDAVTGDRDQTWWGCADAAPALLSFLKANYKGGEYRFELLTSRNFLGLQHNQVVAIPKSGKARVFDAWAGGEVPYPKYFDDTLLPAGQALEVVITGAVEGTGHGDQKGVTGNKRLLVP